MRTPDRGTEFGASTCDASEEDHEERRGEEKGADGAVFSRLLLFFSTSPRSRLGLEGKMNLPGPPLARSTAPFGEKNTNARFRRAFPPPPPPPPKRRMGLTISVCVFPNEGKIFTPPPSPRV